MDALVGRITRYLEENGVHYWRITPGFSSAHEFRPIDAGYLRVDLIWSTEPVGDLDVIRTNCAIRVDKIENIEDILQECIDLQVAHVLRDGLTVLPIIREKRVSWDKCAASIT